MFSSFINSYVAEYIEAKITSLLVNLHKSTYPEQP